MGWSWRDNPITNTVSTAYDYTADKVGDAYEYTIDTVGEAIYDASVLATGSEQGAELLLLGDELLTDDEKAAIGTEGLQELRDAQAPIRDFADHGDNLYSSISTGDLSGTISYTWDEVLPSTIGYGYIGLENINDYALEGTWFENTLDSGADAGDVIIADPVRGYTLLYYEGMFKGTIQNFGATIIDIPHLVGSIPAVWGGEEWWSFHDIGEQTAGQATMNFLWDNGQIGQFEQLTGLDDYLEIRDEKDAAVVGWGMFGGDAVITIATLGTSTPLTAGRWGTVGLNTLRTVEVATTPLAAMQPTAQQAEFELQQQLTESRAYLLEVGMPQSQLDELNNEEILFKAAEARHIIDEISRRPNVVNVDEFMSWDYDRKMAFAEELGIAFEPEENSDTAALNEGNNPSQRGTTATTPPPASGNGNGVNLADIELDDLSREGIASVFNSITSQMSFFEKIQHKIMSFVSGIFGAEARESYQRNALERMDVEERFESAMDASRNGNLTAAVDDAFGLGMGQRLVPAMQPILG